MTYYLTKRNSSGIAGEHSYNTLAKAVIAAQDYVLAVKDRSAYIDRGRDNRIYYYWTDKYGLQFIKY